MIHWKKCKRCEEYFDIDSSQDLCPECRNVHKDEKGVERQCSLQ